ncbi:hypothetical protein RvY_00172-2 [Ramazzottius varieornatus]|nr:hypothetical protein RvY_00172-2 [Ramazzottius varieornatus]
MQRIGPLVCSSFVRQLRLNLLSWKPLGKQVKDWHFPQRMFVRNSTANQNRRQRRDIEQNIPLDNVIVAPTDASPLTELSMMPNFRRWHAILVQLCGNADRYVPSDEWDRTFKEFHDDGPARKQSFYGSMMTLACSFRYRKLGDSILDHFQTKQLPFNIAVASRYIKLLGRTAGKDSAEKILKMYESIRKHFPGDVYDVGTAENLIAGLYQTTKWKDCFSLLKMMDFTGRAGPMAVSFTMAGAFLNKDCEAAMKLVGRLREQQFSPSAVGFAAWFQYAKAVGYEAVKQMLSCIRDSEWYLPLEVVKDMKSYFESLPEYKWTGKFTTMTLKGECKACHEYMEAIVVKKQEFEELQKNFINAVIEGSDVFLHTNPQELQRYRDFVEQNKPFDVIVDGLNVAYHQGGGGGGGRDAPKRLSRQLRVVVEHLLKRKQKKILVVGRKHMLSWPSYEMGILRDKVHLFFAENT